LSNDYYDTYSFANIDSTKGTFNIIGNPFYKTIISTTDVDYDFA
jgi:hypothetical protein